MQEGRRRRSHLYTHTGSYDAVASIGREYCAIQRVWVGHIDVLRRLRDYHIMAERKSSL